jgi:hypothetical protein
VKILYSLITAVGAASQCSGACDASSPAEQVALVQRHAAMVHADETTAIHRYYNTVTGNHYYAKSATTPGGYVSEGVEFHAFATQVAGTVPIYRYYASASTGDHFYAKSAATPGGYVAEGVEFYAYASPASLPTPAPTNAHTQTPTSLPTATTATAIGDPHLVNTRGEHFTIFASGKVEFIRVPYELATEEADFTLHANIQSSGESADCKAARYITRLLFEGSWFEGKPLEVHAGSIHPGSTTQEMKVSLGGVPITPSTKPIDLGNKMLLHMHDNTHLILNVAGASVVASLKRWGSEEAVAFLNVELGSFQKLAEKIGGVLGEDDHAAISKSPAGCEHELVAKASSSVYSFAGVIA